MFILSDSGSTKTDWMLVNNGEPVVKVQTHGINPVHLDTADITRLLTEELPPAVRHAEVSCVFFYGAGCIAPYDQKLHTVLNRLFGCPVEVGSDLLGAARATCGTEAGLVCILGTGSNSCLYDGNKIVSNTPPLGYILGDEGSGAALGKLFLNALYKKRLSEQTLMQFQVWSRNTYNDVIRKVYREPLPNRFLASLAPFIAEHIDEEPLRQLVKQNFRDFFHYNLAPYGEPQMPLHAVGSIAWHFRELLEETAREEGYHLAAVEKSPIDGLLRYHK